MVPAVFTYRHAPVFSRARGAKSQCGLFRLYASDAESKQRNNANADDEHHKCNRIVIKPMPTLYPHDAAYPCHKLTLPFLVPVQAGHGLRFVSRVGNQFGSNPGDQRNRGARGFGAARRKGRFCPRATLAEPRAGNHQKRGS